MMNILLYTHIESNDAASSQERDTLRHKTNLLSQQLT